MISICVAALFVGFMAAALTPFLPFAVSLFCIVAVSFLGALSWGVSPSLATVDAAIVLILSQVGYAIGLAGAAAWHGGQRRLSGASLRSGLGRALFKQQGKS